ncbi:MAG: sulfite exporter TauE/SafE family protein [Bacteroidetes bacterium]|nr:sulfite exporter TauE/SafE family protein [Bacteroidota bacterium]
MWGTLTGGLIIGLFSSLHCVGMCGPLALSMPVYHLPATQRFFAILTYNSGRILTYTILGLIFGYAGRHLFIAGLQQVFSIGIGVFMLLMTVLYYVYHRNIQPTFLNRLYSKVQHLISSVLKSSASTPSFLMLGMANGLLPCGMVYVAIAGALTTGSVLNSMLFMAMFGAATLPAMVALGLVGARLTLSVRHALRRIIPYGIALMALILILRGLNLGIPFISPVLQHSPGTAESCHP